MPHNREQILEEVAGKAVQIHWGSYTQAFFGSGRLQLMPNRVVETTYFIISERHREILLTDIQAVDYLVTGNPWFLFFGILLLPCLVGIVFLVLYFIVKYRYLVVHCASCSQAIGIQGNMDPYLDFRDAVLHEVGRAKRRENKGAKEASVGPSAGSLPGTRAIKEGGQTLTVACPSCGTEYRLPADSTGKKFRCQNCQGIIQAPTGPT
jgi:hypothetical protein